MAAGAVVAHPADKYANATQPWMRYQPRVDTLTAYKPTMTQRIPDMVKDGLRALGLNKFAANAFGSPIADVLGYSPVGAVAQSWDAGQAAARAPGMFGKAAGLGGGMALAALGAVPGGKALARKGEALAMDEASRMARAAEQGFTVDAYHGTEAPDFQQFLPEFSDTARKTGTPHGAFVFSDSPHNASGYAGKPSGLGYDIANFDNGGRVIPAKIALGRTMKVNAKGDNWRDIYHKGESYDINELAQIAQAKGYDSLTVKNVVDSNGYTKKPQTTHFVFNPANIRSKFAAFDPAKRGSANLLAGLGLGGLGYGMVSGSSTDWGDPTQY